MRRAGAGAALAVAVVLISGCGGSGRRSSAQTSGRPQLDSAAIYARDSTGVITVIGTFPRGNPQSSTGSGFVISKAGEVLTNAHVVTGGGRRAVSVYVRFADGNEVPARIVGTDPDEDLALLRVDPRGLTLEPLALSSSEKLVVGAPVATIGSPFGEEGSLSVGVISGLNRSIQSLNGTGPKAFLVSDSIQTDAAVNQGNSGAPLVDASGKVIGIVSQYEAQGAGVAFAVPIDAVKRSLAPLRRAGAVVHAYLGVSNVELFPQLAKRLGLSVNQGGLIDQVTPGSPAARAGIRGASRRISFDAEQFPYGGDVITSLDGHALGPRLQLVDAVGALSPGQRITLEVWTGRSHRTVTLTLGTRPNGGSG